MIKNLLGLLLIFLGSALPIAAQDDYNPDFPADPGDPVTILSYNVSVDINDAKMGYVSGTGKFKYGRTVTISTSAQSGYEFKYWLKDGAEYINLMTFDYAVTGDVTFTAVYEKSSSGSVVDPDDPGATPDVPVYDPDYNPDFPGDPSTPTFPDAPSGGGGGTEPETPTVVNHKLYLVPSPLGSCTFDTESGVDMEENAAYTVKAVAGTDMAFLGWYSSTGVLLSTDATYTGTMGTSDVTLTAKFEYVPEFPDDPDNPFPNVIKGDVNDDGRVTVTDVAILIKKVTDGTASQLDLNVADMNSDNVVDFNDIAALAAYIVKLR